MAPAYKYPRGLGCVPPREGVAHATNDVKRRTPKIGCDVDAESSGSWHRGESPYATPPPVVPVVRYSDRYRLYFGRVELMLAKLKNN